MFSVYKKTNTWVKRFPTRTPSKLANFLSIEVIYHSFAPIIKGIFIYDKKKHLKYIGLNEQLNNNKVKFIFAHEIGHALLHPSKSHFFIQHSILVNNPDKDELEADIFAANLLISDKFLASNKYDKYPLENIAKKLHVPVGLIELKLHYYSH